MFINLLACTKSCIMDEMSEVLNTIHVQFQIDDDWLVVVLS